MINNLLYSFSSSDGIARILLLTIYINIYRMREGISKEEVNLYDIEFQIRFEMYRVLLMFMLLWFYWSCMCLWLLHYIYIVNKYRYVYIYRCCYRSSILESFDVVSDASIAKLKFQEHNCTQFHIVILQELSRCT